MKKLFIILLVAVLFVLSGCSTAAPTQGPAPTKMNAAPTNAGYPAPSVNTAATAYPAVGQKTAVPNSPAPTQAGYPAPGLVVKVTAADGSVKTINGVAIVDLPKAKVSVEGTDIQASKLADLLKLGGITTFTKVTLSGANGTLALTKEQVAQAYVNIAGNGSIQLSVQGIAKDKWISGVQSIKVD
jgi:hypothetical protein